MIFKEPFLISNVLKVSHLHTESGTTGGTFQASHPKPNPIPQLRLVRVNGLSYGRTDEILKKSVEQLLAKIYAGRADIHLALYQLSNQHRRKHGQGCDMYPSDPLQAPLWTVIASLTHAQRILEVGCGHGYTAAVMASAAGPDCRVDTIEENPQHATLAEQAFQERDLSKRITVLRGGGLRNLPKLNGPFHASFMDCYVRAYPGSLLH